MRLEIERRPRGIRSGGSARIGAGVEHLANLGGTATRAVIPGAVEAEASNSITTERSALKGRTYTRRCAHRLWSLPHLLGWHHGNDVPPRRDDFVAIAMQCVRCIVGRRVALLPGASDHGREAFRRPYRAPGRSGAADRARPVCRRRQASRPAARLLRAQPSRARTYPLHRRLRGARHAGCPCSADRGRSAAAHGEQPNPHAGAQVRRSRRRARNSRWRATKSAMSARPSRWRLRRTAISRRTPPRR